MRTKIQLKTIRKLVRARAGRKAAPWYKGNLNLLKERKWTEKKVDEDERCGDKNEEILKRHAEMTQKEEAKVIIN